MVWFSHGEGGWVCMDTQLEVGAVVARVAPSFLRFGSLELAVSLEDDDMLRELLMYIIETFYPEIMAEHTEWEARWAAFVLLMAVGGPFG